MPNFNRVILMGNLTRDPVVNYLPSGAAVCNFGMAINENWIDKTTGEKKQKCVFVDCKAWAKRGETIAQYFHKGSPIHIEGRLDLETWQDKQSGANRSKLSVTVDNFSFIEKASANQNGETQSNAGGYTAGQYQPADNTPDVYKQGAASNYGMGEPPF